MKATVLGEARVSPCSLDPEIVARIGGGAATVSHKGMLVWGEHCTECAMPACYANCSLYTPRRDLKCRRLDGGLQSLQAGAGKSRVRLMRAAFRRWGKLEAEGRFLTHTGMPTSLLEHADRAISRMLDIPFLPFGIRRSASFAWNRVKARVLRGLSAGRAPDALLVEAVGESAAAIETLLTIRNSGAKASTFYQTQLTIAPGYNRHVIAAADIARHIDTGADILLSIEPMSSLDRPAILFGAVDFVCFGAPPVGAKRPSVKCVVWDLDNTLWRGTLVEDGPEGLTVDLRVADLIAALDERGILNSIASKNSLDQVEPILRAAGLWDYFLYPQVHWGPKSVSIAAIAESLNFGRDTLVFIDDQPFERDEVAAAFPEVQTFDHNAIGTLLSGARFDVPRTEEGRRRRQMYKEDEVRQQARHRTDADFLGFLRACNIVLTVSDLSAANIERVFELTERTNQLNYVGRRVSYSDLESLLREGALRGLVLSVADRYGEYGIVGFAMLDVRRWTVDSFFMSCRVQRKKIDHAFFDLLRRHAVRIAGLGLSIAYKPGKRNEPSRVVLEDEMHLRWRPDGEMRLYDVEATLPVVESDIVTVEDHSSLKAIAGEASDAA